MDDSTAALLARVRADSNCHLSDQDLQSVLLSYPACLVAHSDGEFDEEERLFLLEVSELMGEEGDSETPQGRLAASERYALLHWLLINRNEFEAPILQAIRDEIARDVETLPIITAMMVGMAEASDGISEAETSEIERITAAISS